MTIITIIASLIGLIDSAYLSYGKLHNTSLVCTVGFGDCNAVNESQWATLLGIPVAYLGFFAYLVILFLLIFGKKVSFIKPYSDYLLFFMGLVGFLFSLYLTFIEAFVLKTFCQWCLLSAAMITIIFIYSVIKLARRQI